ncbi:histidine kinase dimerization/phospho-acceptor domain-containing protein [Granulosicoccus sp. 3-233]|uniref:histidine kinase dimerization/phospho-acceptor domain-containing protein n=1 Tax=Granulosicoccus sp. 3-233 TaxID=3417969 RepID=UPI003D33A83D
MNRRNDLLNAWDSRCESLDEQQFSSDSREEIASIFLKIANHHAGPQAGRPSKSLMSEWSTRLGTLADSDDLPAPAVHAELRSCQISLLQRLLLSSPDDDRKTAMTTELSHTMQTIDQLIEEGVRQLKSSEATPDEPSSREPKGKVKTLQHEIRTPLQGALLTTELMLEDAQQGDAVQSDDILAVRRSIETAVQVLNEFAEKPG